jgi:hypothetical protein
MPNYEKFTLNNLLWIAGVIVVLTVMIYSVYVEKSRQWHIEAIMKGPIRASKESRIYHVPTCPNYNSIHVDNLRLFQTIEEAESAAYRPAINCSDALATRKINENETDDTAPVAGERPY